MTDIKTLAKRVSKLEADRAKLEAEVSKRGAAVEAVAAELDAADDVATQLRLAQRRREVEADWADASRLLDAVLADFQSVSGQLDTAKRLEAFPARLKALEGLRAAAVEARESFAKAAVTDLRAYDEQRRVLERVAVDAAGRAAQARKVANDERVMVEREAQALGLDVVLPQPVGDPVEAAVHGFGSSDVVARQMAVQAAHGYPNAGRW